jgi:hypothetical protein
MRSPTISIYKPNSNSSSFGRFLEGDELRICYDSETEFPAELARVKEETLSRSSRVSRVRAWVTGLRHFSYPGATGLGRVTAQVTGLRHFSYPGAIRLAGLAKSS